MHPPSHILQQALLDNGDVQGDQSVDWYCWPNWLPDECIIVNAISVYDTSGIDQGRDLIGNNLFYSGVQLLFRGYDYSDVFEKASSVNTSIEGFSNVSVTVESTSYTIQTINQTTDVISLGLQDDSSSNYLFSVNYSMVISQ